MRPIVDEISKIFAFLIVISIFCSEPASAANIVDKFGQSIPVELEEKVSLARKMRLPYHPNVYDLKGSIEVLKQVLSIRDDYFRAWFNLGLAYWQLSDGNDRENYYDESRNAFEKAIKLRDDNNIKDISIFNSAGWVSMRAGDYDRAEKLLLRGLSDIEQSSDYTKEAIYSNLGRVYFYTQKFDKAEKYSKIAIDEFSNSNAATITLKLINNTRKLQSRKNR